MCSLTTCKRYGKIVLILNWMWDIVHWTIQQYRSSHKLEPSINRLLYIACVQIGKTKFRLYIYSIIHIIIYIIFFLIGENFPKSETQKNLNELILEVFNPELRKKKIWKLSDFIFGFQCVAKNMEEWLNICKFHIWFVWFIQPDLEPKIFPGMIVTFVHLPMDDSYFGYKIPLKTLLILLLCI
jgi:hypothetical protein